MSNTLPEKSNEDQLKPTPQAATTSAAAPLQRLTKRTGTAIRRQNSFKAKGARSLFDKTLLEPSKKRSEEGLTIKQCLRNIVTYSWLNVLILFVPISWALHFSHQNATVTFICAALGIIDCAALLSFGTEELANKFGETIGGLLNASLGNTVELLIAILALVKGELRVVQSAMIGSLLSNLLLVLGCCFFAGGLRFHEQSYKTRSAQTNIGVLGLSSLAIVLPAAFQFAISNSVNTQGLSEAEIQERTDQAADDILALSRGTAFILLFAYFGYLVFQLWTHSYLYSAPAEPLPNSAISAVEGQPRTGPVDNLTGGNNVFRLPTWSSDSSSENTEAGKKKEDEEKARLTARVALILIVVVTALCGVSSECLVSSINGLVANNNISEEWTALILLPLIGNAAEHCTAVVVSIKNRLDLSLQVAVGSSIQISLFVLPFLIILAWIIGQPLTLFFDVFETIALFVSVLIVNFAISDGLTNWFEGLGLILVYIIIALSFWFYNPTG